MTPASSKHSLFYILYDTPEVYSNIAPEKKWWLEGGFFPIVGPLLTFLHWPAPAGTVHVMQCKSGGCLDGGRGDRFVSEEVVDEAERCDISKTGCRGRCCVFFWKHPNGTWGLCLTEMTFEDLKGFEGVKFGV